MLSGTLVLPFIALKLACEYSCGIFTDTDVHHLSRSSASRHFDQFTHCRCDHTTIFGMYMLFSYQHLGKDLTTIITIIIPKLFSASIGVLSDRHKKEILLGDDPCSKIYLSRHTPPGNHRAWILFYVYHRYVSPLIHKKPALNTLILSSL